MTTETPRPRRRFRRRTVRTLVEYVGEAGPRCEVATTLGAGGLFIETESPELEGTPLKLRFQVSPSGDVHEIEGRVVWSKPLAPDATGSPGMGIEFSDRGAAKGLAIELELLD